jgi:hypothetical protein
LRWRAVANSSSVSPGQAWPSYTLTSDNEGEYYLASFNCGNSTITLATFVESIQAAFDQFPYANFEVLAKDNFLHFRIDVSFFLPANTNKFNTFVALN